MTARYLVDRSALARMPLDPVRRRLEPILAGGEAATCAITDLEILYSARNHADFESIRRRRVLAYDRAPITEEILQRAIAVQGELAKSGRHRIPIPDLIIAAAAEAAGLTVLHYDSDFDLIAEVTGQGVEWVVERGSVRAPGGQLRPATGTRRGRGRGFTGSRGGRRGSLAGPPAGSGVSPCRRDPRTARGP